MRPPSRRIAQPHAKQVFFLSMTHIRIVTKEYTPFNLPMAVVEGNYSPIKYRTAKKEEKLIFMKRQQ
jgi:hypothetical protein